MTPEMISAEVIRICRDEPSRYDLIGGHIPVQLEISCSRLISRIVSFRNPADVVLSIFYKNLRPEIRERKRKRGVILPDFPVGLEPIEIIEFWQNNMKTNIYSFLLSDADSAIPRGDTAPDIEQARTFLATQVQGFTILEQISDSLTVLAHQFGWQDIPEYHHRNRGENRPDRPDQSFYEQARGLLSFDFEIYDFAVQLQQQRLADLQK